jgi:hypothetical protein
MLSRLVAADPMLWRTLIALVARHRRDRRILAPRLMKLDLTDEEATALLRLLDRAIGDDRYPLSPRIRTLQ